MIKIGTQEKVREKEKGKKIRGRRGKDPQEKC